MIVEYALVDNSEFGNQGDRVEVPTTVHSRVVRLAVGA